MANTSGLIKSLNKAVANFYLKHSEESLFYSQATSKVGHMLCCAFLRCIKKSLHSSGFFCSFFCLNCFHTWRVFCRQSPVQQSERAASPGGHLCAPSITSTGTCSTVWWFLWNYWIWIKINLQRPEKCNFRIWSVSSSDCMSIGANAKEEDFGSKRQPFRGSPIRLA